MMRRPIGYYVHHQGAGHLMRARAIAAASVWPVVLLGTGIGEEGIDLPDDRISRSFDGTDDTCSRPKALHYAPTDHEGIRSRVAMITQWIAQAQPALMVVDVSAEIAMLARLASVPTIYVRLNGDRSDVPHLEAFRGAMGIIAPFHADMESADTPDWVRAKTRYLPGITASADTARSEEKRILVVVGKGGVEGNGLKIAQAARACPDWQWHVIGSVSMLAEQPANLHIAGWIDDPAPEIARASIIIGAAGDGLVGAVMAADRPFICIAEARPFDEQHATALRLGEVGAAVILPHWPDPQTWPALLAEAQALPAAPRQRLHDPDGAKKAAVWLADCANRAIHREAQAA